MQLSNKFIMITMIQIRLISVFFSFSLFLSLFSLIPLAFKSQSFYHSNELVVCSSIPASKWISHKLSGWWYIIANVEHCHVYKLSSELRTKTVCLAHHTSKPLTQNVWKVQKSRNRDVVLLLRYLKANFIVLFRKILRFSFRQSK